MAESRKEDSSAVQNIFYCCSDSFSLSIIQVVCDIISGQSILPTLLSTLCSWNYKVMLWPDANSVCYITCQWSIIFKNLFSNLFCQLSLPMVSMDMVWLQWWLGGRASSYDITLFLWWTFHFWYELTLFLCHLFRPQF